MAESRADGKEKASGDGHEPHRLDHPAELARRELVEWCNEHHLPVPAEPGSPPPQSSAR